LRTSYDNEVNDLRNGMDLYKGKSLDIKEMTLKHTAENAEL